jgi:hypothetical protein
MKEWLVLIFLGFFVAIKGHALYKQDIGSEQIINLSSHHNHGPMIGPCLGCLAKFMIC